MAKVLMLKTVFDGNIYHRAGQKIEINGETLKMYLQRNYATEIQEKIESETVIESKEEKIVYATKGKKKKNATN